ncbi:hypothetical protein AGABI1DRAFT_131541 [Agaricus bisporus var. burnettii JB137-S8]|uniref:Chromo domain-containing protein n=1 Tax=Agaricus bisporus var. burnettii (strain JB137-S8 / ATCC MYA-4627 / FGSC 10392) TaxID=597362 RepID=K5WLP4_AGABU|nr:uncharacterized protein AGABI1DRAFT_131541 [Agaricus bisporus var. burnettii JB137-S8]EKM76221.1 hypothetical protein AGABI1DRAFT_131541 [Agaricus bisporus var. burnettii JB137-S8]
MPVLRTNASSDDSSSLSSSPSTSSSPLSRSPSIPYDITRPRLHKRKRSFVVCGVTLIPTVAFDTFWRFAAERHAVDERRRAGYPRPWTEDTILQKYHFCNTFRVLDKLSQYIITEVIEKGSQEPFEVAFRVVLFNLFTKIETWEMLQEQVGPLKWETYSRSQYSAVLREAKNCGTTLYTGAFQKPAPKFDVSKEGYINHLILLEVLMDNKIHEICQHAWHMADVFEWLISFPSMGEFATYQLMLNLSYSKLLNFHRNDFVIPGPGASSGLGKMFGRSLHTGNVLVRGFEVEVIRWLAENQTYYFERLGLTPPRLGPKELLMDVADIEHTLCELDKYARLAHSNLKGRRSEIRRGFEPKSQLPAEAVLPAAWRHKARIIPRVREDKRIIVEKRYTVSRIKTHRVDAQGNKEYFVLWSGYPESDATWEPELTLNDDAPGAIVDYWANYATQ